MLKYIIIASCIVLVVILFFFAVLHLKKRHARKKVLALSTEEKVTKVNQVLKPFGFYYEENDDSISTIKNPWQRKLGYSRFYDEAAPAMSMIIDCEPVYFDYDGKHYLIEAWKGQYGCTTGAELGIYVNRSSSAGSYNTQPLNEQPASELIYECASDDEMLPMFFELYRSNQLIIERKSVHWWLTGFIAGLYSLKNTLTMNIQILFPNSQMTSAFIKGLLLSGYSQHEIHHECNSVSYTFRKPKTQTRRRFSKRYYRKVNRFNERNCKKYMKLTKGFDDHLSRICFIIYCFPRLFRKMLCFGFEPVMSKKYRRVKPL